MKLTDRAIQGATPPDKGRRIITDDHRDAPRGFALRVNPNGTRLFVLRYKAAGRDRLVTVGEYPTWSLAAARKRATEMRREIDGGADLLEQRREKRKEPTVSELVDRYCAARVDRLTSGKSVRAALERHLVPAIGKRKVRSVRRRDVIAILEALAAEHPRQAGKVLGYVKQVFAYAEDREIIEASPIATLKASKIGPGLSARRRGRVLSEDEIQALWHKAERCGMRRLTATALQLILVTGQRPGEVAGMRWDELADDRWIISAERRGKTESAHSVPLTDTALALLDVARREARRLRHTSPYVFEVRRDAALAVSGLDRAVKSNATALDNVSDPTWGHWRPHDLRRTARTGLAAIGTDDVVAETVIGHTRKGIAATYDVHKYDREKRAALEAWEKAVLRIIDGKPADDNVVPLGVR